jgi:hypothetical protein
MEHQDKDDKRWEAQYAERYLKPPVPLTAEQLAQLRLQYTPTPPPVKQRKVRRSRSQWAVNSRVSAN